MAYTLRYIYRTLHLHEFHDWNLTGGYLHPIKATTMDCIAKAALQLELFTALIYNALALEVVCVFSEESARACSEVVQATCTCCGTVQVPEQGAAVCHMRPFYVEVSFV